MTKTEFYNLRKREGLSQTELARKLKKTLRQIQRYEKGDTPIPYLVETVLRSAGQNVSEAK